MRIYWMRKTTFEVLDDATGRKFFIQVVSNGDKSNVLKNIFCIFTLLRMPRIESGQRT